MPITQAMFPTMLRIHKTRALLRTFVTAIGCAVVLVLTPAPLSAQEGAGLKSAIVDDVFEDEGDSLEELAAAQALAELERRRREKDRAKGHAAIQNVGGYEYEIVAESVESAVKEASMRALKSSAARLYFGDYILLGRDLLEPYLSVYGDRFVLKREVRSEHILADGSRRVFVSIGIDQGHLFSDLEEKHFIAKPKLRPIVAVLLEETIDGRRGLDGKARDLLEEGLRRNELRTESKRVAHYDLGVDVSVDESTLREARLEAQRWDIDVIVTGSLKVQPRKEKVILYDQLFFHDAEIELKLIRIDTGETMRHITSHYSASGLTPEESLSKLLEQLVPMAAAELTDGFLDEWANIMLDKADYRLLITQVSPEQLTIIDSMLRALSPSVQTYLKSYYGDVAVLNIIYPDAPPGFVEDFLRRSKVPQFRVKTDGTVGARRLEIEVL